MTKRVMRRAVNLAKKFEGDWQARMSEALKISWKFEKQETVTKIVSEKANEWKKYGHHRIYVDGTAIVYVDAWGTIKSRTVNFSGYYDVNKKQAVMEGGNSTYKEEIFEAINTVAKNFEPVQKTTSTNFIIAKFGGYDAETGETIEAGDPIFYCEASNGYCLAHNA